MAEIQTQNTQHKNKRTVCTKKSTKVDLTPMVDLGFILITFFIFTSSLLEPHVMGIKMPNDTDIGISDDICESCALTLIADGNNELYYYEGNSDKATLHAISYEPSGLRMLLLNKKRKVKQIRGKDEMVLIIKPTNEASFKNTVDLMDECSISTVLKYYLDEVLPADKALLDKQRD
jgi:biopolymer transport protein ExbD